MYICPICGKEAKTEHGLRTHMRGTIAYGGHELDEHEIAMKLLQSQSLQKRTKIVSVQDPSSIDRFRSSTDFSIDIEEVKNESGSFFEHLLISLMKNKEIPKYQFERRIDTIIEQFLPDIISQRYGGRVEFVVPEFPIKKDYNNQSNNADFLFYQNNSNNEGFWIMAELKTDDASIRIDQLELYRRALAKGMKAMVDEVTTIRNAASGNMHKYDVLLSRLAPYAADSPLKIVYILLTRSDASHYRKQYPEFDFIGVEELKQFVPKNFEQEWMIFRRVVIENC